MYASVTWINDYLDRPATAEEQADLLTRAGFPLEGREDVALDDGSEICQDFEMTSNRGDCVCHIGLAREIAALSGRALVLPETPLPAGGPAAADHVTVTNEEPDGCPLYTARVITGITIKPSPAWLANRLHAIGQIPRNNIVDATNFVLFEYGQPTHVFDLDTLRGNRIIIRRARPDEPFLPIGEGATEVALHHDDLVIADAERAVAIAGVKGGELTAVSETTTNILIEAATFDPVAVRTTSRRHNIASDSSYRFERGVHAGHIRAAADRLTSLILEIAGGQLHEGVVSDGRPIASTPTVSMRPARARKILGVPIEDSTMVAGLARLGFTPHQSGERIECDVPIHRLDIEREIDLIEEVGRVHGLDNIEITDRIPIRVAPLQSDELARQAVTNTLVGLGYLETVTHSLIGEAAATPFLAAGCRLLRVDDERARAEPILRPSVIPSLMRVRKHNLDHGEHDMRLFETASTFWQTDDGHEEHEKLGLLTDVDDAGLGLREMRGTIDRLAIMLLGPDTSVVITPRDDVGWMSAAGRVTINGEDVGVMGIVDDAVKRGFGIEGQLAAAELRLPQLYASFPPEHEVHALPSFPAIERDISVVVPEAHRWSDLSDAILTLELEHLERLEFVTSFRGAPIAEGRKSVTLRLRFRRADGTLTHDSVDPQVERTMHRLGELGADIRR